MKNLQQNNLFPSLSMEKTSVESAVNSFPKNGTGKFASTNDRTSKMIRMNCLIELQTLTDMHCKTGDEYTIKQYNSARKKVLDSMCDPTNVVEEYEINLIYVNKIKETTSIYCRKDSKLAKSREQGFIYKLFRINSNAEKVLEEYITLLMQLDENRRQKDLFEKPTVSIPGKFGLLRWGGFKKYGNLKQVMANKTVAQKISRLESDYAFECVELDRELEIFEPKGGSEIFDEDYDLISEKKVTDENGEFSAVIKFHIGYQVVDFYVENNGVMDKFITAVKNFEHNPVKNLPRRVLNLFKPENLEKLYAFAE